jgi:hypothetical protein
LPKTRRLKFFFHLIVIGDLAARKRRGKPGEERPLRQSCPQGIEFQKRFVLGQISAIKLITAATCRQRVTTVCANAQQGNA